MPTLRVYRTREGDLLIDRDGRWHCLTFELDGDHWTAPIECPDDEDWAGLVELTPAATVTPEESPMLTDQLAEAINARTRGQIDACVASIATMPTPIPSLSHGQARAVALAVLSTPWVADAIAASVGAHAPCAYCAQPADGPTGSDGTRCCQHCADDATQTA